ncbi:hypothetical protein B0H17DRAFT_1209141 [Mycena rosella]|uniref:Zinc finger PHD-type domain-containing protein n=1 Tax=Mycena rosella TaxID=1033263 RepID=A0AAD7G8U3_MYCRO|nr:hypothetical protein B0H17DRAFT_1209141 [Mycena rosella]
MDPIFSALPNDNPLFHLRQMMYTRMQNSGICAFEERGEVKSMHDLQTIFGWLYHISSATGIRFDNSGPVLPAVERAECYFRMFTLTLRSCSGPEGDHHQLEYIKLRKYCQLSPDLCQKYKGNMRQWFTDLIRVTKPEPLAGCWHARDGELFCEGNAHLNEIILNIPIVLIIEIEMGDIDSSDHWDVPNSLHPFPNNSPASARGVKYSIASHVYCNTQASHFTYRYSTLEGAKTRIFDHDGMKNEGYATLRPSSALKGLLTGPTGKLQDVPDGYLLHAVQMESATKKFGIHFETLSTSETGIPSSCELQRQNLEIIPDGERWVWLPHGSSIRDYRVILPQKSPRKTAQKVWHAPMAPAADQSPSPTASSSEHSPSPPPKTAAANKRAHSIPPITMISPTASDGRRIRCHPCDASGPAESDWDTVKCYKCGFWSHTACVKPLAYHESDPDSDAESELSWHDPKFRFLCIVCMAGRRTPTCDPDLLKSPETIHILPEVDDWVDATKWLPAEFLDWDKSRFGKEYKFRWLSSIVWPAEEPAELSFYRSIADWERLEFVWRLHENQIGSVRLPKCFEPVPEDVASFHPKLSQLFYLAIPSIAEILLLMDTSKHVIRSFHDFFQNTPWSTKRSIAWMKACSFDPSPALEAMMAQPLAALAEHPLMSSDNKANQKIWGPGSVFLQLLAIQHTLGENWDLNGESFSRIQAGHLTPSPPRALRAIEAMWLSVDPIPVARDAQMSLPQMIA